MEQKQLDEIEQSFAGEEFIDDDIIIEQVKPKSKAGRPRKEAKKMPEKKVEAKTAPAEKKAASPEEFTRMQPAQAVPHAKPTIEVGPAEPPEEKGLFKEVSTWKMLTGIVLILLLLSVFTQGFSFAKESVTGAVISQGDAEAQALAFVNDNLLQPPFAAQVQASAEIGSLYKITFSIAGEEVDSYMTKDGSLFFPQGFDPTQGLLQQLTKAGTPAAAPAGEFVEEVIINASSGEVITRQVPAEEAETAAAEETVPESNTEYTITAKKWLFSPTKVTVPLGSAVTFRIMPEDMPPFMFILTAFNLRQEVSGPTTVQFTADKKGTFPFSCGSCEEFRGMTGTIVVE